MIVSTSKCGFPRPLFIYDVLIEAPATVLLAVEAANCKLLMAVLQCITAGCNCWLHAQAVYMTDRYRFRHSVTQVKVTGSGCVFNFN